MSYMTFDDLITRPAADRSTRTHLGLVALIVLGLASSLVGIIDPMAVPAEYSTDMVTLTGR